MPANFEPVQGTRRSVTRTLGSDAELAGRGSAQYTEHAPSALPQEPAEPATVYPFAPCEGGVRSRCGLTLCTRNGETVPGHKPQAYLLCSDHIKL